MITDIPRTLLLTRWSPISRFAGGEVQRKIVSCLPHHRLRWAYLAPQATGKVEGIPEHRGFPVSGGLHWRLRAKGLDYLHKHLAARRQAADIAGWVSDFKPQVLWIASDLDGIIVGHHLHHRLGIPLHITIYDAFEWCRHCGVPSWYTPLYLSRVRHLLKQVVTLDGMSKALIDHVSRWQPMPQCRGALVFPPSISCAALQAIEPLRPSFPGSVRRIGFCGASRTGTEQWEQFVGLLGRLRWQFEVMAFASPDCFHDMVCPSNVKIHYQEYQPTELDVVMRMRETGVHACYLGLWREPGKAFFPQTSVSSKMTTYAATGVPIIADVSEDSAVWKMIRTHGAGVRITGEESRDSNVLEALFKGGDEWTSFSKGALQLCQRELNLDQNIETFKKLLCVTAFKP
jgi:hypothetical protein